MPPDGPRWGPKAIAERVGGSPLWRKRHRSWRAGPTARFTRSGHRHGSLSVYGLGAVRASTRCGTRSRTKSVVDVCTVSAGTVTNESDLERPEMPTFELYLFFRKT